MLVSEFLVNLKRRGQYQAAQTVLSDADFVAIANDEMRMVICPKILSVRQNYFMGMKNYTLTISRRYRLPPRILGDRITLVRVYTASTTYYDLPQTSIKQRQNGRHGFYVSQGEIIITGDVPSGTMRVFYPIRPPKMSSTAAAVGTVLSSSTTDYATDYAGVSDTFQVIRSGSPYRTISPNTTVSTGIGTDNDVNEQYERYQFGDILITPDSTHIVPLEEQLCDWLLQRVHMRVLSMLGQVEQLAAQGSKLQDMQTSYLALLTPRVSDQPKVIVGMQSAGWGF